MAKRVRLGRLRAFTRGLPDGWRQPYSLSTSYNVDHLAGETDAVYEWLDMGINIGQFARAGFKSEAWARGYWPFKWRKEQ